MKEGFQGQRTHSLPVGLLQEAKEHALCQGLYVTDIGFYPSARAHKRTRRSGSAQYILLYCVQGGDWYQLNHADKHQLKANQWVILRCRRGHALDNLLAALHGHAGPRAIHVPARTATAGAS
jgi:AraC family transcriptional regulator of arabinose operon